MWNTAAAAPPLSPSMRRATRLLAVLHKSAARASPAEQRRLAQLVIDTCAQPSVQQRVADVALQLAERALLRGICAIFDTQPEGMPVTEASDSTAGRVA